METHKAQSAKRRAVERLRRASIAAQRLLRSALCALCFPARSLEQE